MFVVITSQGPYKKKNKNKKNRIKFYYISSNQT